jgi:hypothetical protein
MLIESWKILSDLSLNVDQRHLAMWEIFHFLTESPRYKKWSNIFCDKFKIEKNYFNEFVKECFELKIYENKIKRNDLKPLPTVDELLEGYPVRYQRNTNYLDSQLEGKIYKYLYNILINHSRNLNQNDESDLLERIETENYQDINKYKIQELQIEYINEVIINPDVRDNIPLELNLLMTNDQEVNEFINHINNFWGTLVAKKSIDFLTKNEFCFWLIKRTFDYADESNVIAELRVNHPDLYGQRPNLPQDLIRCREKYHRSVLKMNRV